MGGVLEVNGSSCIDPLLYTLNYDFPDYILCTVRNDSVWNLICITVTIPGLIL